MSHITEVNNAPFSRLYKDEGIEHLASTNRLATVYAVTDAIINQMRSKCGRILYFILRVFGYEKRVRSIVDRILLAPQTPFYYGVTTLTRYGEHLRRKQRAQ
ncbi:MAG TPA: hypothetical protein VLE89_08930 [Chlamydiales bacterium]|nr:hypothetical protein [Chlamydiales bacterium]